MKKSDKISYHQKDSQELEKILSDLKKELLKLRVKQASSQLKDSSQIKKTKHQIAFLLTLLSQKQNVE